MTTNDITATFGPGATDRDSLSRSHRSTLDAIFGHPVAHGVSWTDVVALVKDVGVVEHETNGETSFVIGGDRRLFRAPHSKQIEATTVIDLRHMLARAGWSPHAAGSPGPAPDAPPAAPDVLVVVEQAEARVYRLHEEAGEPTDQVIRSDLSSHRLHELACREGGHAGETGWQADTEFYERIAGALHGGGAIVLAGHGRGHSDAAHALELYLQLHHADIAGRLCRTLGADLSSLTDAQLRALGRRALVTAEPATEA